jgi:hypothetical protein
VGKADGELSGSGTAARRDEELDAKVRFYLEAVLAALSTGLFILTLISRNWIEVLFHVEPDEGNGSLEWLIVAVLFVVSVALISLTRRDWRRAQSPMI